MSPIRVLLVDDEPLARAGLDAILQEEPDLTVVGESRSGAEAIEAIAALEPDVVFLDIGLPDLDGFEIVDRIARRHRPEIVFVTAHSDRALRAFEVQALDYLTKPLRRARVREAVARARERVRLGRLDRLPGPAAPAPTGPIALKAGGRVQLVDPSSIEWIGADDDHVVVHGARKETWRVREPLQEITRRLDPARFVRIHRSTVVRLSAIRELQPWFHGDYIAVLHSGTQLRLSRTYRDVLARLVGGAV
jgi:two-component system LytT family response regulator